MNEVAKRRAELQNEVDELIATHQKKMPCITDEPLKVKKRVINAIAGAHDDLICGEKKHYHDYSNKCGNVGKFRLLHNDVITILCDSCLGE